MTSALFEFVLSNAIVSSLICGLGLLLLKWSRVPVVFSYGLFVLALLKLVTPPLVAMPIESLVVKRETKPPATATTLIDSDRSVSEPITDVATLQQAINEIPNSSTRDDLRASQGIVVIPEPEEAKRSSSSEADFETESPESIPVANAEDSSPNQMKAVPEKRSLSAWMLISYSVLATWGFGSILLALKHFRQLRSWRRLIAESEVACDSEQRELQQLAEQVGLRRVPELRLTQARISPLAWGFGRSKILLPKKLVALLNKQELRLLLLHELIHLKRCDHWVRLLEMVAGLVYWWLPTYWLTTRSLQQVEERLCDQHVLYISSQSQNEYLEMLMKTLEFLSKPKRSMGLASQAISSKLVKQRFLQILEGKHTDSNKHRAFTILFIACAITLPLTPTWAQQTLSLGWFSSLDEEQAHQQSQPLDDFALIDYPPIQVTGKVVDEQGNPASDAIVRIRSYEPGAVEVVSDANGEFEAEFPATMMTHTLVLVAKSSDGSKLGIHKHLELGIDRKTGEWPTAEITLKEPLASRVRIQSDTNKNLADIQVHAFFDGSVLGSTQTDEQGVANLIVPADAPVYYILAIGEGVFGCYENVNFSHQSPPNDLPRELKIDLLPCLTSQIQFVDAKGEPIPEVSVGIQSIELSGLLKQLYLFDSELFISDQEGKLTIPWIPRDAWGFQIFPVKEGFDWRSGWVLLKDAGGVEDKRVIVLERNGVLEGKVVDEQGNPVGNVGVATSQHQFCVTENDGSFQLEVHPNLPTDLIIEAYQWEGQSTQTLTVEPGERIKDIQIQAIAIPDSRKRLSGPDFDNRPERKFGKVVDADGIGVPNCEVVVGIRKEGRTDVESFTDENGVFEYIDYGKTLRFIFARHVKRNLVGFADNLDSDESVTINLQPGAEITGTVYDRESRLLAGAQIQAYFQGLDPAGLVNLEIEFTDDNGEFTFRGIPEGCTFHYRLRLPVSESANQRSANETYEVKVRSLESIELPPIVSPIQLGRVVANDSNESSTELNGATLIGSRSTTASSKSNLEGVDAISIVARTIESSSRKPIANASVTVRVLTDLDSEDSVQVEQLTSDANGNFEIAFDQTQLARIKALADVGEVYIKLEFEADGFVPIERAHSIDSFFGQYNSKVEILMSPGRLVRGRLVDSDGNPLPNVEIMNIHNVNGIGAGPITQGQTDSGGRFEEWVPIGGYADLVFQCEEQAQAFHSVKKDDPIENEILVVAPEGGTIEGKLLDLEGNPVANRTVNVITTKTQTEPLFSQFGGRVVVTNDQGKFLAEHLALGQQTVVVSNDSDEKRSTDEPMLVFPIRDLELSNEAEKKQLVINAVPATSIEVISKRLNGEPFDGVQVELMGETTESPPLFWTMRREVESGSVMLQGPVGMEDSKIYVNEFGFSMQYQIMSTGTVGYGNAVPLEQLTKDERVELTFYRAPKFRVVVIDVDGDPIETARVEASYVDTDVQPYFSHGETATKRIRVSERKNEGWLSQGLIPDREIAVTITSPGFRPLTKTLTLKEGEERQLTFRFEE